MCESNGARRGRGGVSARRAAALVAAVACAAAPAASGQAYNSHAFAMINEPAVGAPEDYRYALFFAPQFDPVIGRGGHVISAAAIGKPGSPPEVAFFAGRSPQEFTLVGRGGAELPGLPGVFPRTLGGPAVVNTSGVMAIGMDLQGPGTTTATNLGMFVGTSANDLELVIRKGDPVPGGPAGVQIASALFPSLNDSGLLLFSSTFSGPGTNVSNAGLLVRRPGSTSVEPLVLAGQSTPDVQGQVMARPLSGRVNNARQFLLTAGLAGAGISEDLNDVAMFFGTSAQSLVRVAQANDPAPGLPPGIRHGFMSSPTLTQDGGVAFDAELASGTPGLVNTSNDTAIFAGTSAASVTVLMREGDAAPVAGRTDLKYSGVPDFHMGSGGNVVVTSRLAGPLNGPKSGVFVGTVTQGLSAIAVEGARAPGTPANVRFRDAFNEAAFTRAAVNSSGQAAFGASVGTNTTNLQDALYFFDPEQGLILIARAGGTMEVKPGVTKTVSFLDLARPGNGQDFGGGPFNDDGTLVYQASFTDGTMGVFTATVPLAGDVNLDKVVSFADFQALERGFGSIDATRAMGDLNGDLAVTFADFLMLKEHFGQQFGGPVIAPGAAERAALDGFAAAHVPEPGAACVGLAALGWVLGGGGRARQRRR